MTRILARVALFVFAVALSIGAFAGEKTKDLTLVGDAQLNGTTIPAGHYKLKFDDNCSSCVVKVMKGDKTIATANAQMKQLKFRPAHDQVVLQNETGGVPMISEMEFSNSTALSFSPNVTTASGQ